MTLEIETPQRSAPGMDTPRKEPMEPRPERDPNPMPPEIIPPTSHPHPDPATPVT